jgi:hypothetical protein
MVTAVSMGYGHLRAAWAVADRLGVGVVEADRRPHVGAGERLLWKTVRRLYGSLSRASVRRPFGVLDRITALPGSEAELAAAGRAARVLHRMVALGFGARFSRRIEALSAPLLATFYAPAVSFDRHGTGPVACLVTDTDAHRVWAPLDPSASRIRYLAPTEEVVARLLSYGVPSHRITLTGFPLPAELIGEELRSKLGARLARLDRTGSFRQNSGDELESELRQAPREAAEAAPLLTFAVGGAGAQATRARELLDALRGTIADGRLRLALVAGTRRRLAASFRRWLRETGLHAADAVEVVYERSFEASYRRFNRLLGDTDILWTKPGELVFYAALGIPLVLDDPVGDHERRNREWLLARDAAMTRGQPENTAEWLFEALRDGSLARLAINGFREVSRTGTERIVNFLQSGFTEA